MNFDVEIDTERATKVRRRCSGLDNFDVKIGVSLRAVALQKRAHLGERGQVATNVGKRRPNFGHAIWRFAPGWAGLRGMRLGSVYFGLGLVAQFSQRRPSLRFQCRASVRALVVLPLMHLPALCLGPLPLARRAQARLGRSRAKPTLEARRRAE